MAQANADNVSKLNSYTVLSYSTAFVSKVNAYAIISLTTYGNAALTLDPIGVAATGSAPATGTGSNTLGSVGLAASGSVKVTGSLSVTLGSVGLATHPIYFENLADNVLATDAQALAYTAAASVDENSLATDDALSGMVLADALDDAGTAVDPTIPVYRSLAFAADVATLTEAMALSIRAVLVDYATMAASMGVAVKFSSVLSEAATISGKLATGTPITVAEGATLAWALNVVQAITLAERVGVSEVLSYPIISGLSIAEKINAYSALAAFFNMSVSEHVTVSETMSALSRYFHTISEAGSLSGTLTPMLILKIEALDDGIFDDAFDLSMIYRNEVLEQIRVSALMASADGVTAWVVNTRTGAVTEYINFDFNSFASLGFHYLGASSDGLFVLDGVDDDGQPTTAHLRSGYAQFGGSHYAGIKAAYIGMRAEAGSEVFLKIDTTTDGVRVYKAIVQNEQTTKVRLGKGLRARYYAWELVTEGQDWDLDDITFLPLIAQRRV
jgi:hypothetical protein